MKTSDGFSVQLQEISQEINVSDSIDFAEREFPDYLLNPGMEMPEEIVEGYAYIGVLRILCTSLKLSVISEGSYPELKIAPCRFEGSVYTDDMIIASHGYKEHFKNIRNL